MPHVENREAKFEDLPKELREVLPRSLADSFLKRVNEENDDIKEKIFQISDSRKVKSALDGLMKKIMSPKQDSYLEAAEKAGVILHNTHSKHKDTETLATTFCSCIASVVGKDDFFVFRKQLDEKLNKIAEHFATS